MTELEQFLRYLALERNASVHTVNAYDRDIREFCRLVMEDPEFNDFAAVDRDMARTFIMRLYDNGDTKRTVQRKLSAMRSFFRFMQRKNQSSDNPFAGLPPIKSDKPLPVVM